MFDLAFKREIEKIAGIPTYAGQYALIGAGVAALGSAGRQSRGIHIEGEKASRKWLSEKPDSTFRQLVHKSNQFEVAHPHLNTALQMGAWGSVGGLIGRQKIDWNKMLKGL